MAAVMAVAREGTGGYNLTETLGTLIHPQPLIMTTVKEDPFVTPPPSEKGSITPTPLEDKDVVVYDPITVPPLAERTKAFDTGYGPITDALCNLFRIRGKAHRSESLDEVATQPSVYDTPQAEFFQPRADWENIDAFDPKFRWSWREEQVAIRKIDFKVLSWVCLMFFALDMDRGNLANATADNILDDLRLTQADYNLGNTLFRVGFLVAELPSQLVSKRLGPDRWIPLTVVIFSIISASQFWLSGRTSFLLTRFLIAIFQGGFIPDNILYLSYWYNKYDLPVRLAFFWTMLSVVDIVTGFMAVGLLKMRGVLGYEGWRWMFLIEGIITLLIGIASFWMMPVSPAKTKTRFRKNGYITDREAKIIVNRTIRDDPGKGEMHNRQALSLGMIWKSFKDYQLWPIYLIGLTFGIPAVPLGQYLQLSFRQLGFNTTEANLLSIPNQVLTIINLVIITVVSELVGNRSFIAMSENIWMLPCIIALVALPTITGWQYFAISTVLLGYPYVHAIQVGWCSRNSGSIRTRTVSASLYNMFVQTSGIIGSNIYQASDRPRYFKGNSALIGIIAFNLVILYPGTYLYYTWENKRRDKKWDALSEDQKLEYLRTTTDEGCQRLDFRFAK